MEKLSLTQEKHKFANQKEMHYDIK